MPIDAKHKEYESNKKKWQRCRAVINGSDAVKDANVKFLPQLGGQTSDEYNSYLMRANFYGATSRTHQGLLGAIFRKPYTLEAPNEKDFERNITVDALDLNELSKRTVSDVLGVGRVGLLVDLPADVNGRAYVSQYSAENVINWETDVVDGRLALVWLVLKEIIQEDDPDDQYNKVDVEQYRELMLEEGWYKQRVWRKKQSVTGKHDQFVIIEETQPLRKGTKLDFIPFIIINSTNQLPEVQKPPLLDLVDVNLSHYRTSADLEHGAHFTALPTAWVAGFPKDTKLKIGSAVAWVSDNPQANAGFLEYTGQGLGALRELLDDKEKQMAALGARILEDSKKAAESAESLELRQSGEHSALAGVTASVGEGIEQALRWCAWWDGAADMEKVSFSLNTDFIASRLPPDELNALVKTWQAGGVSLDTFLFNLKRGELLPEDRTLEDEKELIEADNAKAGTNIPEIPVQREFTVNRDPETNNMRVIES